MIKTLFPDGRLTTAGAAAYLGLAQKTLDMWRVQGIGPQFIKLGSRVFYFQHDLDTFISQRAVFSTAQGRLVRVRERAAARI